MGRTSCSAWCARVPSKFALAQMAVLDPKQLLQEGALLATRASQMFQFCLPWIPSEPGEKGPRMWLASQIYSQIVVHCLCESERMPLRPYCVALFLHHLYRACLSA